MGRRNKIRIALISLAILIIIAVLMPKLNVENKQRLSDNTNMVIAKCKPWFEWVKSYRKCLLKYYRAKKYQNSNSTSWYFMHNALKMCTGATFDMLNVRYLINKGDVKLIILPGPLENEGTDNKLLSSENCIELTLGVGNDILAEKGLLELMPTCQLHGADPMKEAGSIFETIGKYYDVAVSARSGVFKANVLVGPGIYDYAVKYVPTIGIVDFLTNYVKERKIDYLFMDNEGAEYELLPMFDKGAVMQTSNFIVCQISVELHGPLTKYNMTMETYNDLMKGLMINSTLLPLWSTVPQNHARMFLFNSEEKYCVEKYLQKWCHA